MAAQLAVAAGEHPSISGRDNYIKTAEEADRVLATVVRRGPGWAMAGYFLQAAKLWEKPPKAIPKKEKKKVKAGGWGDLFQKVSSSFWEDVVGVENLTTPGWGEIASGDQRLNTAKELLQKTKLAVEVHGWPNVATGSVAQIGPKLIARKLPASVPDRTAQRQQQMRTNLLDEFGKIIDHNIEIIDKAQGAGAGQEVVAIDLFDVSRLQANMLAQEDLADHDFELWNEAVEAIERLGVKYIFELRLTASARRLRLPPRLSSSAGHPRAIAPSR